MLRTVPFEPSVAGGQELSNDAVLGSPRQSAEALRYRVALATHLMKSSSFPSLRVEPELREAAESVLRDGETLTSLIETSVREMIQRRRVQEEFIARGLRSREDAQRTGIYYSAESVHSELQRRLDARRKSVLG